MKRIGIILAGGKGERIVDFRTHKALLTVYNKTLLEHAIMQLNEAGITNIFVIADTKSCEPLSQHLATTGQHTTVTCVEQAATESLAGALARVMDDDDATYVIVSCDVFFELQPIVLLGRGHDISILVDTHTEFNAFSNADIGVALSTFGRLTHAGKRAAHHNAAFAGIIEMEPRGVRLFKEKIDNNQLLVEFEDIVQILVENAARAVQMPRSLWYDINTPATLVRAEMLARRKNAGSRPSDVNVRELMPTKATTSFSYKKEQTTSVVIENGLIDRITQYRIMEEDSTASQHILITDETVNALLGEKVLQQFLAAGYRVTKLVTPVGEKAKQMDVYHSLAKQIISLGIDEHSIIFALGGGAVANLSGFLAATLYRGIGLVHIPTTFMSMVDVSVSLKQGINDERGKNLIGAYYQPLLVLTDPTIPMPDVLIQHGIAESLKHALGQDVDFYNFLLSYKGDIQNGEFRRTVIEKTLALKIELMHEDMFEHGRGIILQYGHEVGHALEHLSHFVLTHGEAIAIGMRVSAELAHLMNVTGADTVAAHKAILQRYQLPYSIPAHIEREAIMQALYYNKKTRGKDLRFALLEYVGRVWKVRGEYGIPCPLLLIDQALALSYEK